jgi:hypothetical protein
MKRYITFGLILLAAAACKKVQDGYLSQQIRYVDNPIVISRGQDQQTIPVSNDGSSAPVVYELLDIRDANTHAHADSFYANFSRYEWTGQFDASTDTTVALLNAKRKQVDTPPFEFNVHTGSFTFFGTSIHVPAGTYEFDIKASNQNGSREFKNIGTITMQDVDPYVIGAGGCAWFLDGANDNGDLGVPSVDIVRTSTEGTNIILKIEDENGKPFNPAGGEIIARGDRSNFATYAQFHPLVLTDTTMTCNFETVPFPLAQSAYGYLIYYRIPSQFVKVDAGFAPTSAQVYSVNPRFQFNIYQSGTYEVTVKMQHVQHI